MNEQIISSILQKYPVLFAYLFGSHAKGRETAKSDIDIAVFLDKNVSEEMYRDILSRLREELAHGLKAYDKVDLIVLNSAPPLLEREVVYEGKLLYIADSAAQSHYRAQAVSRWLDFEWRHNRFVRKVYAE